MKKAISSALTLFGILTSMQDDPTRNYDYSQHSVENPSPHLECVQEHYEAIDDLTSYMQTESDSLSSNRIELARTVVDEINSCNSQFEYIYERNLRMLESEENLLEEHKASIEHVTHTWRQTQLDPNQTITNYEESMDGMRTRFEQLNQSLADVKELKHENQRYHNLLQTDTEGYKGLIEKIEEHYLK